MKLDLSFGVCTPSAKKLLPSKIVLQKIAQEVVKDLRSSSELLKTYKILGAPPQTLALRICDDLEMRECHRRFKKLDKTTDVLSFPSAENPHPIVGDSHLSLGDLLVSWETVLRASRRHRRSFDLEFREVYIHGLLHLLGFDHIGSSARARLAAKRMKALQKRLSQKLARV
jgi:rRNA maturation RNase YbeY